MKKFLFFILVVIGGIALYNEYIEKPRKNVDSGYYDNSESDEDVNSDVNENSEENNNSQDEANFQEAFNAIKNEEKVGLGLRERANRINLFNINKNENIDLVGDGINQPKVDRYYYEKSPFGGVGYEKSGVIEIKYYYRNGYLIFIRQRNTDQNIVLTETQLNVYGIKVKDGYLTNTGAWFGDFIGIDKIFDGDNSMLF